MLASWPILLLCVALIAAMASAYMLVTARRLGRYSGKLLVEIELVQQSLAAEPEPVPTGWWHILGLPRTASWGEIEAAYRVRVKAVHPDRGSGRTAPFDIVRLRRARDEAQRDVRLRP